VRYLIDGYNLAHALGVLAGKVNPAGLERARSDLLAAIAAAHGEAAGDVTVVFDARSARGLERRQSIAGIEVRFAVGEEADDVIERLVRADAAPKQLAVVSDDRRIREAARRRGCAPLGCQAYLDRLEAMPRIQASRPPPPEKPDVPTPAEAAEWAERFSQPPACPPRRRPRRN
jgi:predicted RNA-binding protein with PIN domain